MIEALFVGGPFDMQIRILPAETYLCRIPVFHGDNVWHEGDPEDMLTYEMVIYRRKTFLDFDLVEGCIRQQYQIFFAPGHE